MKKTIAILLFSTAFIVLRSQTFTQVNTAAGNSVPGLVNGPVASAEFNGLYSLCCDFSNNDMYVADALNSTIRKISNGMVTTFAGSGSIGDVNGQGTNASFYYTSGLCFNNGYVYVSDNGNNKIKKIDAGGNVTTVAGTTIGYQDGPIATAKFNNPTDVKVVPNGDIYVADYGNHCIRLISNGQVSTFAGTGTVIGDVIGPNASARFFHPSSICI
ncbi:MAG TPA: hypothetical protein VL651_05220, partial [Bacteroidia bacterium]|nr:hypothetical protein [Bacteroidia bacterium]